MTLEEMRDVIQAAIDGKKIQQRHLSGKNAWNGWVSVEKPLWNFACTDYRVAPEPKEIWVNEYTDGELLAFATRSEADRFPTGGELLRTVLYREVVE